MQTVFRPLSEQPKDFATAVTYGTPTLLFDYIYNNTGTYAITNKMKDFKDNYDKSKLILVNPKYVPR